MIISHKARWILIPGLFIICTSLNTWLAWQGSHFGIIALAATATFLAIMCGVYGSGWRSSLDGWKRSTNGWSAAQTWGMKQDEILRDALRELQEVDEEAYEIHSGRSTVASMEYLATLGEEHE